MANDYYEVTRAPQPRQRGRAEVISAEMQAIERGFGRLPSKDVLAGSAHLLAAETSASAADAYVLESDYPFGALVTGTTVQFFVTNTNTGPSTADVDGTGEKDIKRIDGTALTERELVAGWPAELVYNGTHWRLKNSAKAVTVGLSLTSALAPQNFQRNVAIADLTLPAATGGTAPYTYAATGLPAGLSFAAATRVLSGTPTTIGASNVTYTVTDANSASAPFQFQIRVVAALIMLPDPQDRTLTVGQSYTFTMATATGGTAPYTYSVEDLPEGLLFDAETREVSGTPDPEEVGIRTVTLFVSDSGTPGQTSSQQFDLTIRSAAALSLQEIADREFAPGSAITPFTIPTAHGGVPDYTYIVTGLGEGLTFDTASLEISGTPSTTGERTVTVRVEDAAEANVERQFSITISPAGARYIAVSDDRSISATDLEGGNSYGAQEQELTLPGWTGSMYIAIAQPADNDDLTSISLGGLGNSISDFEKQSYTRTIGSLVYEIWVSLEVQGDVIAGEVIEVRP